MRGEAVRISWLEQYTWSGDDKSFNHCTGVQLGQEAPGFCCTRTKSFLKPFFPPCTFFGLSRVSLKGEKFLLKAKLSIPR